VSDGAKREENKRHQPEQAEHCNNGRHLSSWVRTDSQPS
jgi:hypothetical protein